MPRIILCPVLIAIFSATALAQAQSENFNSPPNGWRLDSPIGGVGWGFDATPSTFPGGVSRSGDSLNFNNGTDYAGGCAGGALSPEISLAGIPNPVLRFWCNYDTETRGRDHDHRYCEIWSGDGQTQLAQWQLGSADYPFDRAGGIVGIGPGPCAEAYEDLETNVPVPGWHQHKIHLDPAWGDVRVRFVFWSVDDQRNGYAGWAIDDFVIGSNATPAPTGWPDVFPDTNMDDGDGNELDTCRRAGAVIRFGWASSNQGDPGVHFTIGDHANSVLGSSYLYFDPVHGHTHFSQYSDFTVWKDVAGVGFEKLRRGPKRSFCLTDTERIGPGSSVSPGCDDAFQIISYNWQDVYAINTPGQEVDVSGLATSTDYYLIGVIDPINRVRETDNLNQTDQIHFTLEAGNGQVAILDRGNPYPPTTVALAITSASVGMFNGKNAVQVIGTGFDTTLVPVMYDVGTSKEEAPFYTIVSGTEIWVDIPAGISTAASLDLLRPSGHAASVRLTGGTPVGCPPVGLPIIVTATIESASQTSGNTPLDVDFRGVGGSTKAPLEHCWDFGDGTAPMVFPGVASGAATQPSHTYTTSGTFTVTFLVTDADGVTAEETIVIDVSAVVGGGGGGGAIGPEVLVLLLAVFRRRKRA